MKKLLTIILTTSFIVACGGGSGGSADASNPAEPTKLTKQQIEEKFNLPPEPAKSEVDATVLGVDTNGINGRDEIERAIAFKHYKDPHKVKMITMLFEARQKITEAISNEDPDEYKKASKRSTLVLKCFGYFYDDSFSEFSEMESNTFDRKYHHLTNDTVYNAKIGVVYINPETFAKDCAEFKK